jgi:hypothetical protein
LTQLALYNINAVRDFGHFGEHGGGGAVFFMGKLHGSRDFAWI